MEPHLAPARRRRGRGALGILACAALSTMLTAGCGLRLETPPPAEPVPDALEIVRRTAVSDSLHVAESAERAAETARRAPVRTELERIAETARIQAERLGGVYDSGLETGGSSDPDPSPSEEIRRARDVVSVLDDAAARSRATAVTATDGPLARLLASVGASWSVSAARLADLTGSPDPVRVEPAIPAPVASDAQGDGPSPAPTPTDEPTDVSTTAPGSGGAVAPKGLTADELSALIASEDATAFALQLRAAQADGATRERLLARSLAHRERAQAWAALARTDATAQDPRRVAYVVPSADDTDDPTLVQDLENDLAVDYASLVGTSAPGTRTVLVDLLVEASLARDDWGAPPAAFPGLPEQRAGEPATS